MSLYNNLFGENPEAAVLLGVISQNKRDFMRFRDIWLNKAGNRITVYTRCGGSNRKDYKQMYDKMKKNSLYISDEDDSYDDTYSLIYFKVPEKHIELCKKIAPQDEPPTSEELWDRYFERLNDPTSKESLNMNKFIEQIVNDIKEIEGEDGENKGGIRFIGI